MRPGCAHRFTVAAAQKLLWGSFCAGQQGVRRGGRRASLEVKRPLKKVSQRWASGFQHGTLNFSCRNKFVSISGCWLELSPKPMVCMFEGIARGCISLLSSRPLLLGIHGDGPRAILILTLGEWLFQTVSCHEKLQNSHKVHQ